MIAFGDGIARKSSEYEWQGFKVFTEESPNPNFSFLVQKASLDSEKTTGLIFSRSLTRDDSLKIMLPPAMPPPRDSIVPLPMPPEVKKHSPEKPIIVLRKSPNSDKGEEDFKCNALCFSLLGFGKQKQVRSSFKRRYSMEKKMITTSSFTYSTVSIRASLEKFECGSWTSITALNHDDGQLFSDSPVEMMRCNGGGNGGGRDVQEPVSTRFLFDRETETLALKSILKTKSSLSSRRSYWRSPRTSPQRRVRFSTLASVSCPSSPRSCIA